MYVCMMKGCKRHVPAPQGMERAERINIMPPMPAIGRLCDGNALPPVPEKTFTYDQVYRTLIRDRQTGADLGYACQDCAKVYAR